MLDTLFLNFFKKFIKNCRFLMFFLKICSGNWLMVTAQTEMRELVIEEGCMRVKHNLIKI